jgi:prepilin peptidase CpaA
MLVISHEQIYGAAFTGVGILGGLFDLRTRRIPNWITFPAMLVGLVLHGALDGVHGLLSAVLGGVVIFAIMLIIVAMRGMGMGDLKLLLAIGILAGMQRCLWVMFFTVIINGVIAIVLALRRGLLGTAAINTFKILRHAVVRPFTPHPELNLDNAAVYRFPFGVAVGLGCIVTVIRIGVVR